MELSRATPNAYKMIAQCLCNIMTPRETNPSAIWGRHLALKDNDRPWYKNSSLIKEEIEL